MMREAHWWGAAALCAPVVFMAPLGDSWGSVLARSVLLAVGTYLGPTPDWDLARYRYRRHPGAMLFRNIAKAMLVLQTDLDREAWARKREWLERTGRDYDEQDVHRLGTHTVEFVALWTWLVWWGFSCLPQLAWLAPWLAATVAVSLGSHLLLDVVTSSGIPVSILFNLVVYRQPWRMHSLGWVPPRWGGECSCETPRLTLASGRPRLVTVRWYPLAKLRVPHPVPPDPHDRRRRDLKAGLLSVGDDVEHFLVVPVLRLAFVIELLAFTGLLFPLWAQVSLW